MERAVVLGIETSCDDTAVAVVRGGQEILAQQTVSQESVHRQTGGVIPEVASRLHMDALLPALEHVLCEAAVAPADLTAVAVTDGPGLIGSLLSGVVAAKTFAWLHQLPLVPVHHIVSHIYAAQLVKPLTFPLVALVVSGGHTELLFMPGHGVLERMGQTRDDAAGEAFDKVARMLHLPYPGGPPLAALAEQGEPTLALPRAWLPKAPWDFSFSGLKAAVWRLLEKADQPAPATIAASFQAAVVEVLGHKAMQALAYKKAQQLIVVGGVAANKALRASLAQRCSQAGIALTFPPPQLCTDNAAMVAAAGTYAWHAGVRASLSLTPSANRPLAGGFAP